MQYINPFELLNITTTNPSNMDGITVNKAKRKLLAEIDLSDTNTIQYKGIELSKSDCIRITDDLDNKDKCEFHLFILQDKYLNEFLCKGSLLFFDNFRFEYIYKQPEFLDFISPYFSEKYDYMLSENYKTKNLKNLSRILSIKPITNERHHDKCFRSTYAFIRSIDEEINNIYTGIKNRQSQYIENSFFGLPELISDKVEISLINILPSYFQSLRNQLAQTIRNLSTEINNDPFSLYEPAFKIIEISNNILTDGLVKQNVTKAYYVIKKNNESNLFGSTDEEKKTNKYGDEIEIYKDDIDYYVDIIRQIDEIIWQIERKESTYFKKKFSGLHELLSQKIDIPKLNNKPQIFDYARERIAIQLEKLSVIIWNEFEVIEASCNIIQLALKINVDEETKAKIKIDYDALVSIAEKQKQSGKPISKAPFTGTWGFGIGEVLYGDTIYFTVLMIPILPLSRYRVERFTENNRLNRDNTINAFPKKGVRYYGKLKLKPLQKIWKYGFILGLPLLIIVAIANSNKESVNSRRSNYTSPSTSVSTYNNSKSSNSNNLTLPNPPPPPKLSNNYFPSTEAVKPIYTYPNMDNGNITGCTSMSPLYDQNIGNKLVISCGNNADVAVKLIDYETNQTIRYVYINKNTTFTLTKIPEGKYYLKIAYGEKWGVVAGESNCKGRFTENSLCKKGTEILDYNIIHYSDGSYQVPSFSLSLNVIFVKDDNSNKFDTDKISENDFYN